MSTQPDSERSGAPGDLEVVRQFVNSYDAETGHEEFTSPTALTDWLERHDLGDKTEVLDDADLERAVELREALRQVLLANNGKVLPGITYERLNAAVSGSSLEVRFDPDCGGDLVPSCGGLDAAIAQIAATVREAMLTGEWSRLKVCPADDCQWAFYDRSRNRSRTWCAMDVCGNRSKVRTFRERSAS